MRHVLVMVKDDVRAGNAPQTRRVEEYMRQAIKANSAGCFRGRTLLNIRDAFALPGDLSIKLLIRQACYSSQ